MICHFQTSEGPIQTHVEVDVTISTFQLVGHAWLLLLSHWQLELMGHQQNRKVLSNQSMHCSRCVFSLEAAFRCTDSVALTQPTLPQNGRRDNLTWCLTLSVISAEEGLWVKWMPGWNGTIFSLPRQTPYQLPHRFFMAMISILKEGSMLKWSFIYSYAHPIQLWQDIIRIPLKKERSSTLRSGLPLACRGHRLREVPECQVDWEVKQVDEPSISQIERKTWRKYKCCKFKSLFFSRYHSHSCNQVESKSYYVFGPIQGNSSSLYLPYSETTHGCAFQALSGRWAQSHTAALAQQSSPWWTDWTHSMQAKLRRTLSHLSTCAMVDGLKNSTC